MWMDDVHIMCFVPFVVHYSSMLALIPNVMLGARGSGGVVRMGSACRYSAFPQSLIPYQCLDALGILLPSTPWCFPAGPQWRCTVDAACCMQEHASGCISVCCFLRFGCFLRFNFFCVFGCFLQCSYFLDLALVYVLWIMLHCCVVLVCVLEHNFVIVTSIIDFWHCSGSTLPLFFLGLTFPLPPFVNAGCLPGFSHPVAHVFGPFPGEFLQLLWGSPHAHPGHEQHWRTPNVRLAAVGNRGRYILIVMNRIHIVYSVHSRK